MRAITPRLNDGDCQDNELLRSAQDVSGSGTAGVWPTYGLIRINSDFHWFAAMTAAHAACVHNPPSVQQHAADQIT
ncbi:MAG TPA: hypothetical protein DCG12_07685 [Planctomycetaceae bacterium]|nr:hypothetical protein [Planctomycetaceae bacterium]